MYFSSSTDIPLDTVGGAVGGAVGGVIVLLLLAVFVCVVIILIWQHYKRPQHKGTTIGNILYEGAGIIIMC